MTKVDADFRRQLDGYSLATAEITYRMPDALSVLQTFIWQNYDLAPEFPELKKFLDFWGRELDGPLHSVRVAHCGLIRPTEFRFTDHEITVH
ncbi:MAG: usg protein [Pseudomonadota bacterium]